MVYKKKEISVLVLKLPNGNFRITDLFGKQEELSPQDFSRYIISEVSTSPAPSINMSDILNDIREALLDGDVQSALQLIEAQNL
jgi:hypothetical protein